MVTENQLLDFFISSEIREGTTILCITIRSHFTTKLFTTISNKENLLSRYKKMRENLDGDDDLIIFEVEGSGNKTQIYLESKEDLLLLLDRLIDYLELLG